MIAFIISNLFGLARQILVANAFGTQIEMEAFNAANRVSETLFNLVAGGSIIVYFTEGQREVNAKTKSYFFFAELNFA